MIINKFIAKINLINIAHGLNRGLYSKTDMKLYELNSKQNLNHSPNITYHRVPYFGINSINAKLKY
ncbi:MAG: hypothetical protein Kapaf2KO_22790 [Candidatus Kapaibacteriales bacterium]